MSKGLVRPFPPRTWSARVILTGGSCAKVTTVAPQAVLAEVVVEIPTSTEESDA